LKIQLEEAKRTKEVMKSQIMKKEEEVEKLEEEVVTLRVKVVKLNKNIEETETSTSTVEMKRSILGCQKRRMKKREKVMQKYSKEGIMVNQNLRKLIKIHLQEDPPHSSHKEASIMIMIQGRNSKDYTIHSQVCKFILWSLFLLY
jgi:chromosome segregation ATPase